MTKFIGIRNIIEIRKENILRKQFRIKTCTDTNQSFYNERTVCLSVFMSVPPTLYRGCVLPSKARECTAREVSKVLWVKRVSAIRSKRGCVLWAKWVGYYKRSEEVYFEQSDVGNASEASILIKRSQRGCVLPSDARKCIVSEASRVLFLAKWGEYCKWSEEGIASKARNLTFGRSKLWVKRVSAIR